MLGCCVHRFYFLISAILFSVFIATAAKAVSLHVVYDHQEQEVPLYQSNKAVTLSGYSADIAHAFNEQWSISVSGQQSEAKESTTSPILTINAKQQGYSGNVNYFFEPYSISVGYQDIDFELQSIEALDLSNLRQLEKFIYVEDINSQTVELTISRDIDFDSAWLTIDVGIANISQQAQYEGKLVVKGDNNKFVSRDITEQTSGSWVFSTMVSCSTLWAWEELGFVPSAQISLTSVVAGDDVYLFNSVSGSKRSGNRSRSKDQLSEPLTGDSAVTFGGSITALITDSFTIDANISRFYAGSTATNFFSVGLGWQF